MRNEKVYLVNIFCTVCLHIHVNGSVWHSHSSVSSEHMVKVPFNISEQLTSCWPRRFKM